MITTLEAIEEILNQASYGTKSFEELPHAEQAMIVSKLRLLAEIQIGNITDVTKANKWLELIELVYEWALDETWNIEHRILYFDDGIVEIESISEDCCFDWVLDYKDDQLLVNGEEFGDSILHLLNYIESGL